MTAKHRNRLHVEALEDRLTPSSGTTPDGVRWAYNPGTGTVVVTGTGRNDGITLTKDADGTLVINHTRDWLRAGSPRTATDTDVPLGPALNIVLNGGRGGDALRVYPLDQRTDFARAEVNGGDGNDYFVHFAPLDLPEGAGDVILNGGAGNDSIHLYGSEGSADGGAGNDFIVFDLPNISRVRGGAGQDAFALYSVPFGASTDPADYVLLLPDYAPGETLQIFNVGV